MRLGRSGCAEDGRVRDAAPIRQAQGRLYGRRLGTPGWGTGMVEEGGALEDLVVEVAPGGVGLFDEAEFPSAMPAFETSFAEVCAFHGGMRLIPDEAMDAVFPSKAGNDVGFVLPNAAWQV